MMTYRRRVKSDTWHWLRTCQHWPKDRAWGRFTEQDKKPTTGELCNQCLAQERNKLRRKPR